MNHFLFLPDNLKMGSDWLLMCECGVRCFRYSLLKVFSHQADVVPDVVAIVKSVNIGNMGKKSGHIGTA